MVEVRGAIGDTNSSNIGKLDSFEVRFKVFGKQYKRLVPTVPSDSSATTFFVFSFKRPLRKRFSKRTIVIAPKFPKNKKIVLLLDGIDVAATNRREND
jgi:hypothetical protein